MYFITKLVSLLMENPNIMQLRVKDLLKERGMKMADLAGLLGMNQSNLSKALDGNPTLSKLQDIADALDVPVRELLPDAPPASPAGVLTMGNARFALVPLPDEEKKPSPEPLVMTPEALKERIQGMVEKCSKDGKSRAVFASLAGRPVAVMYDEESRRYLLATKKDDGDTFVLSYTRFFKMDDNNGRMEWDGDVLSETMIDEIR